MYDGEKRSDFIYWKRPWQKWVILVAALLQLLCLWMNIQEYNDILNAGILSPSEWANYASQKIWQCAINVLMTACLMGVFLVGVFARSKKAAQLMEGLLLLLFALAWGVAGFALHPFSSIGRGLFWSIILLISFGGAVHGFWQYSRE